MREAGYTQTEIDLIRDEVDRAEKLRRTVKLRSGDYVDMKVYEPAMRHLLDMYIRAEESEKISAFDNLGLVDLLVEEGANGLDQLPEGIRSDPDSMAETIENNVRRVITDEMAVTPRYYEKMSNLLDDLIQARRSKAVEYKEYLARIEELARRVQEPTRGGSYPPSMNTTGLRSLYDNLKDRATFVGLREGGVDYLGDEAERLALEVDRQVQANKRADWRGNRLKEREVYNAIKRVLPADNVLADTIFEIVKEPKNGY
ncbi:MAG: hypothetical protein H6642_01625 [Caldilineaceae bacterium]|nr:hypothetical protein [Caldilineaceae bacterium]